VTDLLAGGAALASAAVGLFFVRYWQTSRDRLFLAFSAAFLIFGANRVVLALSDRDSEDLLGVYSLRLAAFVVIIAAVVDRNRR
jgi:hypothetical protein